MAEELNTLFHQVVTMPLDDLAPWEGNPRAMTERALAGLRSSIERWGLVEPIIWNRQTGRIVGGHQRYEALRQLGETVAQVTVVDLPEIEERALNVQLNNPHVQGTFTDALGTLLDQVLSELGEVQFDALALDDLLPPVIELELDEPTISRTAQDDLGDGSDVEEAPSVTISISMTPAQATHYGKQVRRVRRAQKHDSDAESVLWALSTA